MVKNLYCEACNGILLEQTIWYDDQVGYISYYICSQCGHIKVDDKYKDRVLMIEETYWKND